MSKILITTALFALLYIACDGKRPQIKNDMETSTLNDPDAFQSGYFEVNGINMYYETHGNKGDYLVLIHGGGSTIGTTFGRILPLLADHYRVVAVELQAHGHTGDRDAPESFEQDADDVAVLLKKMNITKASLLGFSNGGNTAMQIAIRHPDMVNKLIIASAFYKRAGMQPGFFEGMEHATLANMPQELQAAFLKINNNDSAKLLNMFTKDRDRMRHFTDWSDTTLQAIKAQALIISGDQDVATNAHTVEMSGLIRNSRLMILPATHGSYLGAMETPGGSNELLQLTVEIFRNFLNGN